MGCDVGLHDGEAPGEGRDEETMDDEASTPPPCGVVCERGRRMAFNKKRFLILFRIIPKISVKDWKFSHTNKVQKLLLF
jgi:hypothetical protein